jgi:hypothetical protein
MACSALHGTEIIEHHYYLEFGEYYTNAFSNKMIIHPSKVFP